MNTVEINLTVNKPVIGFGSIIKADDGTFIVSNVYGSKPYVLIDLRDGVAWGYPAKTLASALSGLDNVRVINDVAIEIK